MASGTTDVFCQPDRITAITSTPTLQPFTTLIGTASMDTPSLVSQKLSDSGRYVQLHPLVLLTISDHLTRHTARQQKGPVLGALLGQQNGQEITLEHAFECSTTIGSDGEILLPDSWFEQRLQQCQYTFPAPGYILSYITYQVNSQGRAQRPTP